MSFTSPEANKWFNEQIKAILLTIAIELGYVDEPPKEINDSNCDKAVE